MNTALCREPREGDGLAIQDTHIHTAKLLLCIYIYIYLQGQQEVLPKTCTVGPNSDSPQYFRCSITMETILSDKQVQKKGSHRLWGVEMWMRYKYVGEIIVR